MRKTKSPAKTIARRTPRAFRCRAGGDSRGKAGAAFTLVELLIVVAVIAILASLLFPALGAAKALAKRTACASNLKQIGAAYELYSCDYNGYCPATARTPFMEGTHYVIPDWTYFLWPYVVGPTQEKPCAVYETSYMKSVFFCNAYPIRTNGGDVSGMNSGPFYRYGMNPNIFTAKTGVAVVTSSSLMPFFYPSSYPQSPSKNALAGEEFQTPTCYISNYYAENGCYGYGLISHSGGTNFLFFDKHVEFRKYPGGLPPARYHTNESKIFWEGF